MSDVSRAIEQIAAIHDQMAKTEIYRGWRPVPVALSGVVGLAAAGFQSTAARPVDPWSFTIFWVIAAAMAFAIGSAEIVWHYARHATAAERRLSRFVSGQFLPPLVAGAVATVFLLRVNPALVVVLPGLWALLFSLAIFAARPYVPRGSVGVAIYYSLAGVLLLWTAGGLDDVTPWSVGGTFGVGQLLAALTLAGSRTGGSNVS